MLLIFCAIAHQAGVPSPALRRGVLLQRQYDRFERRKKILRKKQEKRIEFLLIFCYPFAM